MPKDIFEQLATMNLEQIMSTIGDLAGTVQT